MVQHIWTTIIHEKAHGCHGNRRDEVHHVVYVYLGSKLNQTSHLGYQGLKVRSRPVCQLINYSLLGPSIVYSIK